MSQPPPPPPPPPTPSTHPSPLSPRIQSASPTPRQGTAQQPQPPGSRKSAHATSQSVLPPELTDLLHRTCTLAAGSPHAAALLKDALRSLDAQLSTPPRDNGDGDGDGDGGGGGENRDPNISPPYLQMSPRARAQLCNLRRGCDDVDVAGSRSSATDGGAPGGSGALARCIMPAPGEHAAPLWTTAPAPSATQPSTPSPSPLREPLSAAQAQVLGEALVGQHVSVYCYIDDMWRTAVVTALLPDGAHELVYLDGYTERTVLDCRLWRRVSG